MTVAELIRELSSYQQDKEIEIECPNGLMVRPRIKRYCETMADIGKPTKSYVVTWRD
jgi:hypothetical protein